MIGMDDTLADLLELDDAMLIPCGVAYDTVFEHKDLTMREGLETEPFCTERWACWIIKHMGQYFEENVRIEFLKKIEHEMKAYWIYVYVESLSESEDEILRSIFEGKLPDAEKQLEDGVVTRAKDA